jgi:hypothetical protein
VATISACHSPVADFPAGVTHINSEVSFEELDRKAYYFNGHLLASAHEERVGVCRDLVTRAVTVCDALRSGSLRHRGRGGFGDIACPPLRTSPEHQIRNRKLSLSNISKTCRSKIARDNAVWRSFAGSELVCAARRQTGAGRGRRATQPPARFHRNPLGRGQLAVFPRCSLDPYDSDMGALPPVRLGSP